MDPTDLFLHHHSQNLFAALTPPPLTFKCIQQFLDVQIVKKKTVLKGCRHIQAL